MFTGKELVHVISFLLQMGFKELGVPFRLAELDPLQANIAAHMAQLGLLLPFRSCLPPCHCNQAICAAFIKSLSLSQASIAAQMAQLSLLLPFRFSIVP